MYKQPTPSLWLVDPDTIANVSTTWNPMWYFEDIVSVDVLTTETFKPLTTDDGKILTGGS